MLTKAKISYQRFDQFHLRIRRGEWPYLRFGQAFIYWMHDEININITDPTLFYEESNQKAMAMILDNYIKW